MRYCKLQDKSKLRRLYIEFIAIYLMIVLLVVAQNRLFLTLIEFLSHGSVYELSFLFFISNGLANFILFIALYVVMYRMAPSLIQICEEGLVRKEAEFVTRHKLLIAISVLAVGIFTSIVRIAIIATPHPSISTVIEMFIQSINQPHGPIEIAGYLVGILSLELPRKEAIKLHILSYPVLFLAALLEAKEIVMLRPDL